MKQSNHIFGCLMLFMAFLQIVDNLFDFSKLDMASTMLTIFACVVVLFAYWLERKHTAFLESQTTR